MNNKNINTDFKFEKVRSLVYLGFQVNLCNYIKQEISERIQSANKCYYGMLKHLKSELLTYTTKIELCKTSVKPVLIYESDTWVLIDNIIKELSIIEIKILRKICGPTKE